MTHGPEHHIEHAEHAAHASHDEFNKKVTMSIAIVAAVLACVTMLGHRAHNETLIIQGEALKFQTEVSKLSADRANDWAYYQSKNAFNFMSEIMIDTLNVVTVPEDKQKDLAAMKKRYEESVEIYSGHKNNRYSGKKRHVEKDKDGKPITGKLAQLEDANNKKAKSIEELEALVKEKVVEHHFAHARAIRIDFGELGLQFGVVLCSLAILMKSRSFWFAGLLSSAIGAAIAATGQFGLLMDIGGH